MHREHAVERGGHRHVDEHVEPTERRRRLGAQVVGTAALELDREADRRRAEPEPEREEVGSGPSARPEIDRAQLGPTDEVREVGRRPEAVDPLCVAELLDAATVLDEVAAEPGDTLAQRPPTRSTLLDHRADHHHRRQQHEREELQLAGEHVEHETGGERSEHGDGREPPWLGTLGDRPERLGRGRGHDGRAIGRAVEVDPPEPPRTAVAPGVDGATDAVRDRTHRQASTAERHHVGRADHRRGGDLDAVHQHPVRGERRRVHDDRAAPVELDREVVPRHRRVVDADGGMARPPDDVPARASHQL